MGLYIWPGTRRLIWGRAWRITLNNDFSCTWQVGTSSRRRKAALQHQKRTLPTVLIAYRWRRALPSPTSSASKHGEALLRSRFFFHTSRSLRLSLSVSPEGLVTRGSWCNIRAPKEDTLSTRGRLRWTSWDSGIGARLCLRERREQEEEYSCRLLFEMLQNRQYLHGNLGAKQLLRRSSGMHQAAKSFIV